MVIPRAVVELDEAHAAFREPAREQAVRCEGAVARFLHAIRFEHRLGLLGKVRQVRHRGLHLEGHLVLRDARLDLGIDALGAEHSIQPLHLIHHLPLRALAHARGIADVMHRVAFGLKLDALEFAREEPRRPLPRRHRLRAARLSLRHEHDESRQALRLRAEPVEHPRTHARAALHDRAGVHEGVRRIVIDLLGVHRAHDA